MEKWCVRFGILAVINGPETLLNLFCKGKPLLFSSVKMSTATLSEGKTCWEEKNEAVFPFFPPSPHFLLSTREKLSIISLWQRALQGKIYENALKSVKWCFRKTVSDHEHLRFTECCQERNNKLSLNSHWRLSTEEHQNFRSFGKQIILTHVFFNSELSFGLDFVLVLILLLQQVTIKYPLSAQACRKEKRLQVDFLPLRKV